MTTSPRLAHHCPGVALFLRGFALAFLLLNTLRAQVGNDNPTGPAGKFNGSVTTGGSYDPYTGNANRTITDMVVTGAVGSYGLSYSRTWNTRNIGWHNSYDWSIADIEDVPAGEPMDRIVSFPDGRSVNFGSMMDGNRFFYSPPGVSERLRAGDPGTSLCYLILSDGGQVEFHVTTTSYFDWETQTSYYSYYFTPQAIVDPYGQRTTLTYPNGNLRVTEPGGRWIQVFGSPEGIDYIQASDGRIVDYTYETQAFFPGTQLYTVLKNVTYPGDGSIVATYSYDAPNVGSANGSPLLVSCDDPMYAGPMKKISYTYATGNNPDGTAAVYGQILSENSATGQAVSTLTVNSATARTETRGDGPSRTFNYNAGRLANYTDFKGQMSSIFYDGNGYVWAVTDARGKTTTTLREGTIGAISVLTHPDQHTQGYDYKYAHHAPYFLQIRGDERGKNTYFTRDGNNRVTKIWYPDYPNGPTEEFSYNGFGQVETHTMTSGGVANFRYDARGLMYHSWPPATPSDPNPEQHPTQYFYYTSGPQMDRLWYVVDPRGNATWFEYNQRGQITRVTHQDGSYIQNAYNPDGTLDWAADENHPGAATGPNQRTRYTYDDYKRVVSVTNPLNQTANLSYAPWNGSDSYSHTTGSVYRATSPLGKLTDFNYDENFRRALLRQAPGTTDEASTIYGYDAVGNLTSVQDPRGNVTSFGYDDRNRRTSATNPAPFHNQITQWEYDGVSNLRFETRPDNSRREWQYDSVNRVIDTYGFANEHTHYDRDLAGNVEHLIDPKNASYDFGYDALNRKTSATYPLDATGTNRSESWLYDWAGNLYQYTNPAGQMRTHNYDNRNRPWDSWWNAGGGPLISTRFDPATRLSSVVTRNAVSNSVETTVTFGYDDANRQVWEEQTVAGFPTRRIETPRDDDGLRGSLHVPGFYLMRYDYTQRNQLRTIYDGGWTQLFNYSYDAAGNRTKRQGVYGGVNDSTNIMDGAGVSQYDALNRPMMWEQTGAGNASFARSHFSYDSLGRLTATWRDEQAGKGEWFGYNATGQLTGVSYNADGVSTGNPQNASRTVNYTIAPNRLNRASMNDSGDVSDYTPNALNQYENVGGTGITYDGNFNLTGLGSFGAGYDSARRLVWAQSVEDSAQFVYDGLGRCLKRTVNWETILIAYDGWKPIVEWDEWGYFKAWNVYGPGAGRDPVAIRQQLRAFAVSPGPDGQCSVPVGFGRSGARKIHLRRLWAADGDRLEWGEPADLQLVWEPVYVHRAGILSRVRALRLPEAFLPSDSRPFSPARSNWLRRRRCEPLPLLRGGSDQSD